MSKASQRLPRLRARHLFKSALCGGLLGLTAALNVGAIAEVSIEPEDAPIGQPVTRAEFDYEASRQAAAGAYRDCLVAAKDDWLGTPDYTNCDTARSRYASHLAAEIADLAIGCLETGVIGEPRESTHTCEALRARFSAPLRRDGPTGEATP